MAGGCGAHNSACLTDEIDGLMRLLDLVGNLFWLHNTHDGILSIILW
jgi:hypothetical protein